MTLLAKFFVDNYRKWNSHHILNRTSYGYKTTKLGEKKGSAKQQFIIGSYLQKIVNTRILGPQFDAHTIPQAKKEDKSLSHLPLRAKEIEGKWK